MTTGTQALSVCVVTNAAADHLGGALAAMRDYADELVVTVDSRAPAGAVDVARELADSVAVAELDGLAENARGWTAERARGDWILALDDDEMMAPGFSSRFPELLSSRWSHFHLPVLWVAPGPDGSPCWLRQFPWYPNQATRLFRNVSGTFRHPARLHSVWEVAGDGCSLYDEDVAIYHLNLALFPREARERKLGERYRPLAAGGLPTCEEYYLYEDYSDTLTFEAVPDQVAHALAGDRPSTRPPATTARPPLVHVTAAELASYRAGTEDEPPIWSAEYLGHDTPSRLFTNRGCTVKLSVRNTSAATWGTDGQVVGRVVLSYRWRTEDGQLVVAQGDVSLLPHPCAPGETVTVVAGLWTPAEAGRYVLEWEMLCERVAWFSDRGGGSLAVHVDVEELGPRPRAPHFPSPVAQAARPARLPVLRWLTR
jgi:hypothetical protein